MDKISNQAQTTSRQHETELLLHCVRTCIDTERAERIRALVQGNIDWGFLIRTGFRHGVTPLLYQSLNTTCPDGVPPAIHDQFRSYLQTIALHNLFLTQELINILKLFEAHDIPAIPYKGPVLAASIYANLALREFTDLDILVHEHNYHRAKDFLLSQGYRSIKEFDWESSYLDVGGRVTIDLHQGLTSSLYPFSLDFDGLWRRLEPISISGAKISHLSPEDMLIVLCIQLAKDGWLGRYELLKICDIAELLNVHQSMDWGWIMEEVRRLRSQRILLVGLMVAAQLLGTVLPKEVLQSMQGDPLASSLATQMRERLFDDAFISSSLFHDVARSHWQFRERVPDKVYPYYAYYAHFFVPNELDRSVVRLPEFLSFLYFLIRPCRLFWIAGIRCYKRLGRKRSAL